MGIDRNPSTNGVSPVARGRGTREAWRSEEGFSAERLYRWRRKLTGQAFVEVERESVGIDGCGVLEVVVATGRVVRVPRDFDAVALQRLLAVLEADPC